MKIIQKNKKAFFDYEILETFKTGIVLTGSEIKSIRLNNISFKGAYVSIQSGEAFLKGMHISRYRYDSQLDYDPFRDRKLLLTKKELYKINNQLNTQGVTVIPITIGLEGKWAKVEIAIARGKKKHDKRQNIKDREMKRSLDRITKQY